jgi:hypothetical protein
MSYFMRFISTDAQATTLTQIESGLRLSEPRYSVEGDGTLVFDGVPYGLIDINRVGDESFAEEIEELTEAVDGTWGLRKRTVLQALRTASELIVVQILSGDRTMDATLSRIDPLWRWLFTFRSGLLQVDDEGFYNSAKRILKMK